MIHTTSTLNRTKSTYVIHKVHLTTMKTQVFKSFSKMEQIQSFKKTSTIKDYIYMARVHPYSVLKLSFFKF